MCKIMKATTRDDSAKQEKRFSVCMNCFQNNKGSREIPDRTITQKAEMTY